MVAVAALTMKTKASQLQDMGRVKNVFQMSLRCWFGVKSRLTG